MESLEKVEKNVEWKTKLMSESYGQFTINQLEYYATEDIN
jgi:hypothetical protein